MAQRSSALTMHGVLRRVVAPVALALTLGLLITPPARAQAPFGPLAAPAVGGYAGEVLADGAIAYWRMGEAGGATMVDETGANNGTYSGGVALGQPGARQPDPDTAALFNGTTGRATAPDSSSLDRVGAVSVEVWAKRTKSAAYQVVVGKPGNGQSRFENYAIWFNTTNRPQAYFGNGSTFVSVVGPVLDTNWHHIVATYDNAVARLYVDGAQVASVTSSVALGANALPFNAARTDSGQYFFGGSLDEVAIYPTALSAARIQAHYNAPTVDTSPPLVTLTQPANGSSTSSATPALSGVAGTASGDSTTVTVRVYAGSGTGGTLLQTLTATRAADGSYSVSPAALSAGTYTAQTTQGDAAGNTGASSANTFTVDTSAPAITLTSPADSSSQLTSTPAFSGVAGTAAGDSSSVTVRVYNGTTATGTPVQTLSATRAGSGGYSVIAATLANGTYTARAEQTDAAGNSGQSAANTFTVTAPDETAPVVSLTQPANGSSTSSTTPALSGVAGTASGDSTPVTVRVYAGSGTGGTLLQTLPTTRAGNGSYSVSPAALAAGTYTAQAAQSDAAGNTGTSGANTFTVDTSAPAITLTSPANGSSTTTATPEFSGIAGTAAGDSSSVTVRVYSGTTATGTPLQALNATRGGDGGYSATAATLANGTYTAQSAQSDAAGNAGTSSANTFTVNAAQEAVMIGAGDITSCENTNDSATAALLAQHPTATVFTLGDNTYVYGQPSEYTNCYGPTWGAHKARTRPITGGHDTDTPNGGGALPNQGFSDYFNAQLAPYGETATNRLKAYYSYDVGSWHVVALNSACYYDLPGCNTSQMEQWFAADLAASQHQCTAVMWHDSRWSSGNIHGNQDFTQPLWQIAYDGGADIVLGANEHDYERFAPQDAAGALDTAYGVRQFVVGTGGYYLYGLGTRKANSQVYDSSTYGVLKLTLRSGSYDWQFLPVAGGTFTDSGTGSCHGKPAPPGGTPTVRSKASASAPYPSSSLTISRPAGAVAGDVLLATIAHQGGSSVSITPPAGFTNIPAADVTQGTNARLHSYWKVATGSEPATYGFALNGSGMSMAGGLMAFQGASTSAPINAAGGQAYSSSVTQLTAPSITTTKPDTALVYSAAVNQNATFSPPQLMPEQWDLIGGGAYQVATTSAVGGVAAAGATGPRTGNVSPLAPGVATLVAVAGP